MKHPKWRQNLQAVISKSADKPLKWGELDCFTFMDDCVYAIYGEHLLDVRGQYDNLAGAVRYYKELQDSFEENDIIEYMDNRFTRSTSKFILDGEIVARPEPDGEHSVFGYAFGIVTNGRILFVSQGGLVSLAKQDSDIVWRKP